MKLASWQQTRIYSCGPACLMTALAEMVLSDLSERTEMLIWRQVRHLLYLGSTPAKLGLYARSRGVSAELVICGPRPADFALKSHGLHRLLQRYLLYAYRVGAKTAAGKGLAVTRADGAAELLRGMEGGCASRAIVLVVDEDEILHFLLLRFLRGEIAAMDPAFGTNSFFSRRDFLDFHEARGVGYWLLLSDGGQSP